MALPQIAQTTGRRWYAAVFRVVTGQVYGELPLAENPTWTQQINQPGSWSIKTPIGGNLGVDKVTLRQYVSPGLWGIAICYGTGVQADYIAQAGPIVSPPLVSESPPILQINGTGIWGMLNARWQIPSGWVSSAGLGDSTSIATYTGSNHDIAAQIISNQVTRGTLPIDSVSLTGGTATQTYPGSDLVYAGAKLSELTQIDKGPDVVFLPYFSDVDHIRFQPSIGNPTIAQPNGGLPIVWDYGSNCTSILPVPDGSRLATTTLVKGNGISSGVLWGMASDSTLINAGWPLMELINTARSNVTDQATINAQAVGDQALYGRPVETWTPVVRVDMAPALGTYSPGINTSYNIQTSDGREGHCWIPDGLYTQRLLGLSNGQSVNEVVHILQARQGVV
jgi:hypothetical protein